MMFFSQSLPIQKPVNVLSNESYIEMKEEERKEWAELLGDLHA